MPIINTNQNVPTVKDKMMRLNTSAYSTLKSNFEQNFNFLNKAENPQAVLDLWGTAAVSLFRASAATIEFLRHPDINPDYVPPTTPHTYTFNEDGTVTWNVPEPIEE